MGSAEKHTISVLMRNRFGVLARVAGLFSGRGYNISSLTVNATHDPEISQMTIVTIGDDAIIEQIEKQLNKLIDIIHVRDLTGKNFVEKEMALFRLKAETPDMKSRIIQLVEIFHGQFVAVSKTDLGIEISGDSDEIDNFIELVKDFGIIEMARSGRVAISK